MSILDGVQQVLRLYAQGHADLSFSEVCERLGLPKSSASRLLNQMQNYGLLEQDMASRRYRTGALLAQAVQASQPATPFDEECRQVLVRLSEATGLTAYLSTLNNGETVVLQRLNGSHPVQVLSSPGSRRSAAGTGMGRALLSRLSPAEFEAVFGRDPARALARDARSCPGTVGELVTKVDQARTARCGMVIDEAMPGIGAVAAAVRHPATAELRGLCVSFVAYTVDEAQIDAWRRLVIDEVGALGRRIGDPFWGVSA